MEWLMVLVGLYVVVMLVWVQHLMIQITRLENEAGKWKHEKEVEDQANLQWMLEIQTWKEVIDERVSSGRFPMEGKRTH